MKRTNNTRTLERLVFAILLAQSHKPRHLSFCNIELFAAEVRKRDVFYNVVFGHRDTCIKPIWLGGITLSEIAQSCADLSWSALTLL